ncbi:hypothetical protein TWF718_010347 [Orbilia javanica]|uniref:Uncharacterized protein n=1 Tax=Orbilia javanica TaxID=47235 RepID=A0AAN8R9Z6_9PEZI
MSTSFVNTLLRRSEDAAASNSTIVQLLTALVVLAGLGLLLGGILVVIRRVKSKRSPTLPTHTRNLTVTPIPYSSSKRTSWFGNEKSDRPGTPTSPVPEIRITFPEEESADGKRKSGRVVVVQVGEAGAAFVRDIEPDNLPPYQKGGFSSVDLNKVGGLKEKEWA